MDIHHVVLVIATLLSSLTAGLVFAFAVVVMPGIRSLPDRDYLRAFKVMDRVIQENDPLFLLVWVGSALAVVAAAALAVGSLVGPDLWLVLGAAATYLVGVQLPTVAINVPLNNRLQALELDALDQTALGAAREAFEARWNRWNSIRTVFASLTALMLLIVLASCTPEPAVDQGAAIGEGVAAADDATAPYMCPICDVHDPLVFYEDGTCPVCGMRLIERPDSSRIGVAHIHPGSGNFLLQGGASRRSPRPWARILAGNSGFYTLPDPMTRLPFGLEDARLEEVDLAAAFDRRLVLFLGEEDNETETGGTLLRSPTVDRQGTHRLQRGRYFYEFGRQAAERLGVPFRWSLEVVPGVGHDHRGMSRAAAEYLYGG